MISFKQFLKEEWNTYSRTAFYKKKLSMKSTHTHTTNINGNEVTIGIEHNTGSGHADVGFSVNRETDANKARVKRGQATPIVKHVYNTVKKKIKEINPKTVGWGDIDDTDSNKRKKKLRLYQRLVNKSGQTAQRQGKYGGVVKLREQFLKAVKKTK